MDNFKENTNSELLTQLLDGELSPAHEETLYSELSTNKELQEELRQQLLIRESIRKDTEAYNPPSAAVIGLFNKLGYAPPYTLTTGSSLFKTAFWSNMFKRASVSVAIIALLTVGGYNLIGLLNDDEESIIANHTQSESHQIIYTGEDEFVLSSNNETQQNIVQVPTKNIPVMTSNSIKVAHNITEADESAIANESVTSDIATTKDYFVSRIKAIEYANSFSKSENVNLSRKTDFSPISYHEPQISSPLNITFYLKTFAPNGNLSSLGTDGSILDNKSIGFNFIKKGNLSSGLEFGKNSYRAKVTSDDDDNILIDKDLSILWYTLNGRYDAKELEFFNMHPFVQGAIGSGNFGKFMVRYNVGMEYSIHNTGLAVMAGWEGSNLWYSTQNRTFNSNNSSMVLGISIKF